MTRTKANAYLLMVFIMIPSLTHPLKLLFNSGVPVYIATTIIIGSSLFLNRHILLDNKNFIVFSIIITLLYIVNIFCVDYKYIVLYEFIEFMKFGFIAAYLAYQEFSFDELGEAWFTIGIINIIAWTVTFESVISRSVSYMFFGNSILYSYVILIYSLFNNKYIDTSLSKKITIKFLEAIATFSIGIILLLFANRGAILAALLVTTFIFLKKLVDNSKRYKIKVISLIMISLALLLSIIDIKKLMLSILEAINIFLVDNGISSYSIKKFILQIEDGLASASSGRDEIFQVGWDIAKKSALPKGIGYFNHSTGLNYPHNIFIDVYIIMGYIIGTIFLSGLIYLIIKSYKMKNRIKNDLLTLLLIISVTKLLLSSSIVFDTLFWVIFAIITKKDNDSKFLSKST